MHEIKVIIPFARPCESAHIKFLPVIRCDNSIVYLVFHHIDTRTRSEIYYTYTYIHEYSSVFCIAMVRAACTLCSDMEPLSKVVEFPFCSAICRCRHLRQKTNGSAEQLQPNRLSFPGCEWEIPCISAIYFVVASGVAHIQWITFVIHMNSQNAI